MTESFETAEELASLLFLQSTTAGEDPFLSMCETMKEIELFWTKLEVGLKVCFEGKQVLWTELGEKWVKKDPELYM
jgi:hypothetical protein